MEDPVSLLSRPTTEIVPPAPLRDAPLDKASDPLLSIADPVDNDKLPLEDAELAPVSIFRPPLPAMVEVPEETRIFPPVDSCEEPADNFIDPPTSVDAPPTKDTSPPATF